MKKAFLGLAFCLGSGAASFGAEGRPTSAVVGASADYNALFDTRGNQTGTGVDKTFKSAVVSKIPRSPATPVPTISFNGLSLKSVMFSDQPDKIDAALAAAVSKSRTVQAALSDFSLPGVTQAISQACARGDVTVQVIVDESRKSRAALERLSGSCAAVTVLRGLRANFVILDGRLLETGSFGWTAAGGDNYESALFRDDEGAVATYAAYWKWAWSQSKSFDHVQYLKDAPETVPSGGPSCTFSPAAAEAKTAATLDSMGPGAVVDIAAGAIVSQKIAEALVAARKREAIVRVVLDRQAKGQPTTVFLKRGKIDVKLVSGIGGRGSLRHAFALFDGKLLETGAPDYGDADPGYRDVFYSAASEDITAFQAEFEYLYGLGQGL